MISLSEDNRLEKARAHNPGLDRYKEKNDSEVVFCLGLFEPFYCGEAASIEAVVRICPVWWTIRGSNPGHPD